ncbi:MAG: hypothetical protein HY512_01090, partial [Candidatus Aenigmarchaeota archaeon]|nr:hypothetical protein [Candidatus Aenigmarchaeota archaeon]
LYFSRVIKDHSTTEDIDKLKRYIQTIRHELTHWDIESTTPYRAVRGLVLKLYEGFEIQHDLSLEIRDAHGLVSTEQLRKIIEDGGGTGTEIDSMALRTNNLDIFTLNEALAYAVQEQGEQFQGQNSYNTPQFISMFDYFKNRIISEGTREVIRSAKSAIEEAWAEGRNVTNVLGLKVA